MRNGRDKLDIPYLAIVSVVLLTTVVVSFYFFPQWRESPATTIVLLVAAVGSIVGLASNFRTAFIRERDNAAPAALDYDSPQHRRNQENVCANVRAAWIDGVLRESLPERIRIELALDDLPGMLRRRMVAVEGQAPRRTPVDEDHLADLFRSSGRALLILGAPGSGKTVTLLELCRPLLEGAEADPRRPVPVVLNLSTWAQRQSSLEAWIGDEMWRQYGLNRQVTSVWLAAGHLILLFDGLDEMAADARDACVRAINTFRENHGAGMVVCSRSADYTELHERLALSRAVEILPLRPEQVDAYLSDERLKLDAVRQAIARDDALRELSTTPLMLNIMAVAYGGRPLAGLLPLLESEDQRRAHLYDAYIGRVFARRPLDDGYPAAESLRRLRFLAAQMTKRDETQFFIEDMQPDWLPGPQSVRFDLLVISVVLFGLVGALVGIVVDIMGLTNEFVSSIYDSIAPILMLERILWSSAFIGFQLGMFFGVWLTMTDVDPVDEMAIDFNSNSVWKSLIIVVLSVVLGILLFVLLLDRLLDRLVVGVGGMVGALLGAFIGIFLLSITFTALFGTLFVMLRDKVRSSQSKRRDWPNQGMRRSATNALRGGVLFGMAGGMVGVIMGGVAGDVAGGVVFGVLVGVSFGVLAYGGNAVIKHYFLRLLLALRRLLPLRLVPFLEAMRERILLQRAGGHYRFIHRTMQEHIAAMTDEQIDKLQTACHKLRAKS